MASLRCVTSDTPQLFLLTDFLHEVIKYQLQQPLYRNLSLNLVKQ